MLEWPLKRMYTLRVNGVLEETEVGPLLYSTRTLVQTHCEQLLLSMDRALSPSDLEIDSVLVFY